MISAKPSKQKIAQWEYKKHQLSQLQDSQEFQLYLLANPSQLKKQFIEQVPYLWCHNKIGRERQFQIYLNELNNNQLQIHGFPYVDNMLQYIDQSLTGNFKVICQASDLQRILQYHSSNKKLICIHVFDQTLTTPKSLTSLPRNKKIEIKASQFKQFKRLLYRKNYQKNQIQTFMNATRITNWDIAEVNQSRLVLKTLLVSKNDRKGKEDFVKLANCVEQQLGKVSEYETQYNLNCTPQEAIKWYTKESFYHRLVNNTLKAGKGNPLLLGYIRFPVKQLYNSIKSLYNSRKFHRQSFECYRGGRISQKQLQYFRQNVKGFIEMQGFLSCSKNKKQMQEFIVNCVFKITVNNLERDKQWDHGFCILDDKQLTQYVKEEEVLFNIFCVMEIKGVTRQIISGKQIDVVALQYGSLASLLYQKKHELTLKDREYSEKCINNYLALKPYYDSITNQVDCFRFFGKFKQVEEYYLTFLKHIQKHQSNQQHKDSVKHLNAYYSLGQNYLSMNAYVKAKQYFIKAREIAQSTKSSNQDQLLLSKIYNGLGIANKNLNKLIQAKQNYMRTIKLIQRSRNRNGKIYLATAYNNLALILVQQLQQDNAIEYYHKALNLIQGQQNQTIANIHYNLGQYYLAKSLYKQSIKNLIKSLEIYTKIFGTHKQTINCHMKLGEAYLKNGSMDYNKHFSTALDMMKNLAFHSQSEYIKLKREIEELKNNQNKARRAASSVESYQAEDIFSFLGKNKQEVNRYLSKDKISSNTNNNNRFYSQKGIVFSGLGSNNNNNKNMNNLQHTSVGNLVANSVLTNNNSNNKVSSLQTILFGDSNNHNSSNNNNLSNNININSSSSSTNNNNSINSPFNNTKYNNISINNNRYDNNASNLYSYQSQQIKNNQTDKLRQLRAKNLLDTQIPTTYQPNILNNNHSNNHINKSTYNLNSYQNHKDNIISPLINNKKVITDPTYQDAIDQKMASFNQNDFINNLKLNRPKRHLIFG